MREISIVGVLFTLAGALYSTGFGGLLLWNAQSGGANARRMATLGVWALVVAGGLYLLAGVLAAAGPQHERWLRVTRRVRLHA